MYFEICKYAQPRGIKEPAQALVARPAVCDVTLTRGAWAAVTPLEKLWLSVDTEVCAQPLLPLGRGSLVNLEGRSVRRRQCQISSLGGVLLFNSVIFSSFKIISLFPSNRS